MFLSQSCFEILNLIPRIFSYNFIDYIVINFINLFKEYAWSNKIHSLPQIQWIVLNNTSDLVEHYIDLLLDQ
jgi:hypothetical protein